MEPARLMAAPAGRSRLAGPGPVDPEVADRG